ncbi:hypothetical protein RRG08_046806 [Elysia crispata]|uniref:Uncharacterized protein n=1 Tax=Elysia crispata TaxID=231223 RepID=A0AAE0ZMS5_9GAST|nr:hypothetical protein RRG08_046806 [Elysia crispata]
MYSFGVRYSTNRSMRRTHPHAPLSSLKSGFNHLDGRSLITRRRDQASCARASAITRAVDHHHQRAASKGSC